MISFQNAKKLAVGKEDDALQDIGVSSNNPKAVVMWMQELQLMNTVKNENSEDIEEINVNDIELNIEDHRVVQSFTEVEYTNSKHNEQLVVVSNLEFDKLKLLKKEKENKLVTESSKKIKKNLNCDKTKKFKL